MSDEILSSLILAIPGTLAALISLIALLRINRVEKNTNSITERLGKAKFAEGEASGKEKEQKRSAEIKSAVDAQELKDKSRD